MTYLELSQPSAAYASALSQLMWGLCGHPDDTTTTYYCGWIVHPTSGAVALTLDDQDIYIQPTATADAIIAATGSAMSPTEQAELTASIQSRRGSKSRVTDILPASIASNLLSQQEATDAGWFDNSSL
jgi:hypothetical protein